MNNSVKVIISRLLTGRVMTNIGDSLATMSIIWYFTAVDNSPFFLSLSFAMVSVVDVLSFLIGPVIDKKYSKKMLVISSSMQMAFSAGMVVALTLARTKETSVGIAISILILLILSSIASSVIYPLETKMLPMLLSGNQLLKMNGIFQVTYKSLDVLLNATAGLILAWLSVSQTLIISICAFGIATGLYNLLKLSFVDNSKNVGDVTNDNMATYIKELKDGWIALQTNKTIFYLIIPLTAVNFFYAMAMVALPKFSQQLISKSAIGYGMLLMFASIGAISGSALVGKLTSLTKHIKFFIAMCMSMSGLFWALMAIVGSYSPYLLLVLIAISSAFTSMMNISFITLIQSVIPNEVLGRVSTINESILSLMIPLGSVTAGAVIGHVTPVFLQLLYGISMIAIGVYYLFFRPIK